MPEYLHYTLSIALIVVILVYVARMLMAHFNSNTDILKFNPNIEWIDRWGRNFTEMEPVMVFEA